MRLLLLLRRIRRARRADRALAVFSRLALVIGLVACAVFPVARPSAAWLVSALVVAAGAACVDSMVRVSLFTSAVSTDRALGLDERLATSLELLHSPGEFAEVQVDDALRSVEPRLFEARRVRPPRELYFSSLACLVAVALVLAPSAVATDSPERAPAMPMQKFSQAAAKLENLKLEELKAIVQKIASQNDVTPQTLSDIRAAQQMAEDKLKGATGDERRALEEIAQLLADAGYAAARALRERGELGTEVLAPSKATLTKFSEAAGMATAQTGAERPPEFVIRETPAGSSPVLLEAAVARAREARTWPRVYDEIIARFYGGIQ